MNRLAERIKHMREVRGLTQAELADAIGISRMSVSNYEAGDRTPDANVIIKLALYLDVSADYLLGLPKERACVIPVKTYPHSIVVDGREGRIVWND